MTVRRSRWTAPAAVVAALFIASMVVWPLVAVVVRSLAGVGPADVFHIVTRPSVRSVVGFTLLQATLSAAVTVLLGLPVAHLLARFRFRGKAILRAAVIVPFVLPTVVVAAAVDAVFDRFGLRPATSAGSGVSLLAILYAHTFFNLAVVARLVGGYWAGLDHRQVEAARVLGAGRLDAWRTVTLRQLRPAIIAAALVVFLFSFTSFGVIRILGGLRTATIETEIYRYAIARAEFDTAAVLAVLQIVVVVLLSVLSARFQRRYGVTSSRAPTTVPVRGPLRWYLAAVVALVMAIQGVPVTLLVAGSLSADGRFSLVHYRALVDRVDLLPTTSLEALGNSLVFALGAAVVALMVGVSASIAVTSGGRIGRLLEALTFVPLGVSAVTLGFGYLVGFTVFDLRQSIWLLPLAHAVVGLPFVVAAMVPTIRSIGPRVREAAGALGASPSVVWRTIDWPIARRAAFTGAGFAAAVSLGEFGATSFLARGEASFTAPLAIFRLLSTPGAALRGQALALSVVVGLLVAVLAAVLERRRSPGASLL